VKSITTARIFAWGQLGVTYLNQALSQNGGVIPTNKSQWMTLLSSLVVAFGVHIASETSAGHPQGSNTPRSNTPK
jgi:hypothetical protein